MTDNQTHRSDRSRDLGPIKIFLHDKAFPAVQKYWLRTLIWALGRYTVVCFAAYTALVKIVAQRGVKKWIYLLEKTSKWIFFITFKKRSWHPGAGISRNIHPSILPRVTERLIRFDETLSRHLCLTNNLEPWQKVKKMVITWFVKSKMIYEMPFP